MAARDTEPLGFRYAAPCLSFLALCFFFGGCSQTPVKQAGPAGKHSGRASAPDAIPWDEPLSPYGNPESYEVFGQRYYPLKSSRGFVERGIASWYGPGFHRKRTSSGEPYDMYAMTAAHRVLPLPTYVEVTHLGNGRKAVVKVNDRGPFKDDRVLDLSFAAAQELGIHGPGTAWVEVRALSSAERRAPVRMAPRPAAAPARRPVPEKPPAALAPASDRPPPAMFLQIGAFTEAANAERFRVRIRTMLAPLFDDMGLDGMGEPVVHIRPSEIADRYWYRVQVGPLIGAEMVARVGARLSTVGLRAHRVTPDPL